MTEPCWECGTLSEFPVTHKCRKGARAGDDAPLAGLAGWVRITCARCGAYSAKLANPDKVVEGEIECFCGTSASLARLRAVARVAREYHWGAECQASTSDVYAEGGPQDCGDCDGCRLVAALAALEPGDIGE